MTRSEADAIEAWARRMADNERWAATGRPLRTQCECRGCEAHGEMCYSTGQVQGGDLLWRCEGCEEMRWQERDR